MNTADWHSLYVQQSASVMTFWNVYLVVVFGLIGFVIQKAGQLTKTDKIIFMVGFGLFASSNLVPLYYAQVDLINIYQQLPKDTVFKQPGLAGVVASHLVFDIIILGFLYLRPIKE